MVSSVSGALAVAVESQQRVGLRVARSHSHSGSLGLSLAPSRRVSARARRKTVFPEGETPRTERRNDERSRSKAIQNSR